MTLGFQMTGDKTRTVAIIGGGFTGAAVAYRLASLNTQRLLRIVVIEPREDLGRGVAYGTVDASHRINVPASRMTFVPGLDDDFQNWLMRTDYLSGDEAAVTDDGRIFPRRAAFGTYIAERLRPLLGTNEIEHLRDVAIDAKRNDDGWQISLKSGNTLRAENIVLATTHPKPRAPYAFKKISLSNGNYISDSTVPGALDTVRPDGRVLIVGSGLTAADIVASLAAKGHRGRIDVISRRGLRSRSHPDVVQDAYGEFADPPIQSSLRLLRHIRATVREASGLGISWHSVFDKIRAQAHQIWSNLSVVEKRKLVRHLRVYWDVHRFRVAPQVAEIWRNCLDAGRLQSYAASIESALVQDNGRILVALRPRRMKQTLQLVYDNVIIATGPSHTDVLISQSLTQNLADRGNLQLDKVGLGLAVDALSRACDKNGYGQADLYIAGPLARGEFGELMGLPQVTAHAQFVADTLYSAVATDF